MLDWLPDNVSTFGDQIDALFHLIYLITAAVCILVLACMTLFLILYRRRQGRAAHYSHGNTILEVIWTVVPAVILVVLTVMSGVVWRNVKERMPETDVLVKVIGKQFNWKFQYPGPDGRLGTDDDLVMENELTIPVNRKVRAVLTSEDVIHSFFLPNLRVKQDTLPGREIVIWFEATRTGDYEIACAELCGFGHYNMRGHLHVRSTEDYRAWVEENWPAAIASGSIDS